LKTAYKAAGVELVYMSRERLMQHWIEIAKKTSLIRHLLSKFQVVRTLMEMALAVK
jgi:hypothetical protein